MPQVKVGHLRAIPAPPALDAVRDELVALGDALAARNAGIGPAEQARLDDLAARAYALDGATRSVVLGVANRPRSAPRSARSCQASVATTWTG